MCQCRACIRILLRYADTSLHLYSGYCIQPNSCIRYPSADTSCVHAALGFSVALHLAAAEEILDTVMLDRAAAAAQGSIHTLVHEYGETEKEYVYSG